MNNRICDAFNKVHAEDALKSKTTDFLYGKIQNRDNVKKINRLSFAAVLASFMLLLIIGGVSYNLYFTASTYIDIDINPSIELTVNLFGKVIEASPYNNEGATILKEVNVQNVSYEYAVETILDAISKHGYLKKKGLLSVTIQTNNDNKQADILNDLQNAVNTSLQTNHSAATANIFSVTKEIKNHAHDNLVTPAKYLAIKELQAVDSSANFDDCKEHTISEINKLTQEHGSEHHSDDINGIETQEQKQPISDDSEAEVKDAGQKGAQPDAPHPQTQHEDEGGHH